MPNSKTKAANNRKSKPKQKPVASKISTSVLSYARLLADPCAAPLAAPEYGASDNGYLSRFRNTISITTGATGSGYLVWFPDHCNGSGTINGVAVLTESPESGPALQVGTGAALNTPEGRSIDDPAMSWLESSVCEDMRCIAACATFVYTGAQLEMAGRVAIVEGITQETLLNEAGAMPATPGQLMNASRSAIRTPVDPIEVKWRPTETSRRFRGKPDAGDGAMTTHSTNRTYVSGAQDGGGLGYGFAWEGLPTNATFVIVRTKAVEWRPQLGSLIMDTVPRNIRQHNVTEKSLALLDSVVPGWQEKTKEALVHAGSSVFKRIMSTDVIPYLAGAGMGMLGI